MSFPLLIDPEWADGEPPFEAVVGVWADGRFRSNPEYRPRFPESPSDPVDAVLRLGDTAQLRAVLEDATFELAMNGDGRPLVVRSPDDRPGLIVATSAPHRERVPAPAWRTIGLDELPGEHDVLVNPGGPAPVRLAASFFLGTAVTFVPVPPADLPYLTSVPAVVDETAGGVLDHLDLALLEVLDLRHTSGVWRCWRVTTGPGDQAAAVRVYVIETTQPGASAGRRALAAAGHAAEVEVYPPGGPLSEYQWAARSSAALIWAPHPAGPVRLAGDSGPPAMLDEDELAGVVTYLRSAPALAAGLRTDGEWIWPADLADRALEEGTLGDPDLLRHLRQRAAEPRDPADAVALHRALVALIAAG